MYKLLKQNPEIWNLFTREEDYSPTNVDKHGRVLYDKKELERAFEPKVSKYLVEEGMKIEFPENKTFAVCLTHDIDEIYPPLSHTLLSTAHCLKNLDFQGSIAQLMWKFNGKERSPYFNFLEIMDLEAKFGAKSSFYFIATEDDPIRFRYHIEDIGDHLGEILDKGWEVGLHGGYYSFDNPEAIKREKKRLEDVLGTTVRGFRNHYLRFKTPDSWEILEDAGFSYDSTFGYSNAVGFRNGMCHPFRPYNLKKGREVNILEIPLVIMDDALFTISKSFEEAWQYTKKLIDITANLNGVITLLWHNYVFSCNFRNDWLRLYKKILKYCFEKRAWITSGEEIYKWWER
jgi:peptidoglycan/xylan/chitin deacetylase (PgdA/CDA1 family)